MKKNDQHYFVIGTTLLILALFAFLISTTYFYRESLRLDEAQGLWQTSQSIPMVIKLTSTNVHVPGYHLLLHLWQVFVGSDIQSARLLSTIFMLLSIPAIFILARRLYDQRVALYATILFSLSPFMLWYGSEIRMYALLSFLVIIHQYLFIRLFRQPGDWSWIFFAFISILGIFVHYFFFLVILTEVIFFLVYKKNFVSKSRLRFGIVALIVLAAFLPWATLVFFSSAGNYASPILTAPTSVSVFNLYSQFLFGFQGEYLNSIILATWPLAIALFFFALGKFKKFSEETIFLIFFIVIPVSTVFLISAIRPVFLTRYLILVAPSFFIFVSWFLSQYHGRFASLAKISLIVVMISTLAVQIEAEDLMIKEPFREMVAYLESKATPRDVIAISAPFIIYPVEYFYQGNSVITTLPIWNRYVEGPLPQFSLEKLEREVEIVTDSHERIFLLLSYDQGYEEEIREYFDHNFHKLEARQFTADFEIRVYRVGYASDYFIDRIVFPNP